MKSNENLERLLESPAYRLAFEDIDFLGHEQLRPVRLQLELQKAEMIMDEHNIHSTVVVFGSARLVRADEAKKRIAHLEKEIQKQPHNTNLKKQLQLAYRMLENSRYYEEARKFSRIVSTTCQVDGHCDFVIVTGGGPGIMEAANLGAFEVGAKSIGLNITLPFEDLPNPYITPELCFQFQYFAIRKMHFLLRARALVVFPGGFGTLDELFEALTLIQTRRMDPVPVLLFGKKYWQTAIDFQFLVEEGMIGETDLALFEYVETAEEAWQRITEYYAERGNWPYVPENNGKFALYPKDPEAHLRHRTRRGTRQANSSPGK